MDHEWSSWFNSPLAFVTWTSRACCQQRSVAAEYANDVETAMAYIRVFRVLRGTVEKERVCRSAFEQTRRYVQLENAMRRQQAGIIVTDMIRVRGRVALLAVVVMTVACDRVSKHFAAATLAGEPRQSFLADTVRLEYAENTGAFLSLGSDWSPAAQTAVFTVGTGLILCAMAIAAVRYPLSGPARMGLALYLAGGTSNLVDRIVRGSVIDFMNVGIGSLRTGIFNVADMAILVGVAMFIFSHRPDAGQAASRGSG